jgi:hypothetical protein
MLDQLLSAAMQKTNVRIDARNDLAVELEHKAQNAVGRRVLGPEVDGEIADSSFGHIGLTSNAGVQRRRLPQVPKRLRPRSHSRQASPRYSACPFRKLYPHLAMVQSRHNRNGCNGTVSLDPSTQRCILV